MPELPEVQTVVATLHPRLIGRTIRQIELHRQDIVTPQEANLPTALLRRRITDLSRRGKRIIFTLDNGNRFYIHLGMTGQLTAESPDRPLRNHTHLVLTLDIVTKRNIQPPSPPPSSLRRSVASSLSSSPLLSLRFRDPRRFGGIFWLGANPPDDHLGPEPLTMTPSDLADNLSHTTRPIKSALMNQTVVAGLGNIYVDESLHAANLHPLTSSNQLTSAQIKILTLAIKSILRRAIKARGTTLRDYIDGHGRLGTAQNLLQVYARENQPCPTCQTPIQRIVLTGRSTHFCPKCQPL